MSEKIAVITLCRKGSQRFSDKVRYPFLGIPLYMHTVTFAELLGYPYFFAHDYNDLYLPSGVNEIKREEIYAGPEHRTCEEIKSFGIIADVFIFLQVTSPLRDLKTIRKAIAFFVMHKDYLCGLSTKRTIGKYSYNGNKENLNFDQNSRSDNGCTIENIYSETGSFYIFRKEQLEKKHILDCPYYQKMFVEDKYNIDINTIEDLQKIERRIED